MSKNAGLINRHINIDRHKSLGIKYVVTEKKDWFIRFVGYYNHPRSAQSRIPTNIGFVSYGDRIIFELDSVLGAVAIRNITPRFSEIVKIPIDTKYIIIDGSRVKAFNYKPKLHSGCDDECIVLGELDWHKKMIAYVGDSCKQQEYDNISVIQNEKWGHLIKFKNEMALRVNNCTVETSDINGVKYLSLFDSRTNEKMFMSAFSDILYYQRVERDD